MGFRHLFAILVLTATVFMPIGPADADVNAAADEAQFVVLINQLRTSRGLNPLLVDPELVAQARQWSQVMAADNELKHASDLAVGVTANWEVLGENVGVHSIPNLGELFQAFVKSPAHLSNLLDPRFEYVGTGVVYDGHGAIWTTHRFMSVREEVAPAPATTETSTPAGATAPVSAGRSEAEAQLDRALISAMIADLDRAGI